MREKQQTEETEKAELLSDLELVTDSAEQTTAGTGTLGSGSGMSAGKVSVRDF